VIAHRRLRAPREDRAVLVAPSPEETARLLAGPCSLDSTDLPIAGKPLRLLRAEARRAVLAAAQGYLEEAGQPAAVANPHRVLTAGHQPEIFHPGVWVKNFALHGLARARGLTPLNLVVDNDAVKATALALPCWPGGGPPHPERIQLEKVSFDRQSAEAPYEEQAVAEEERFAHLPEHAAHCTAAWPFTPLLETYWAAVRQHARRTPLLGERLAAGRRDLERRWGCANLEVPVSRVCDTEPFAWFAAHLFADVNRFHATYNDAVHDYRRVHGLRSRNHPVPDLAADGAWREVPLWAWRAGQRRRGRLLVRPAPGGFELRSDGESWPTLPADPAALAAQWRTLRGHGFKLRSRALLTTLFTRLCVADLFLHGIGGGKYDELTDEIVRRFFGIEPPPFAVLSATLLLPLATFPATESRHRDLARELRDLRWNPQRHLVGVDGPGGELLGAKRAVLAELQAGGHVGRERHRLLRRLTDELEPHVRGEEEAVARHLADVDAELRANAILQRRDYAFCLYPEALLRGFCEQFLRWE
jgi:hypothetical protein